MDGAPCVPAAQYVRMSTEHQRYSIEFQSRANSTYARGRGYEIVQTYADEGVSGLELKRREGLKQLLADVMAGAAGYSVVVVYDVSRWGRFQDPDESAHYEFLCRQAGVRVEYSAEPFDNDGTLTSAIVKTVKRAMAAEYVRELSSKIRAAKRGLNDDGYFTGGPTPYGFRRCMISPDGGRVRVLEHGERKALQGYRVVLIAGPEEEAVTVRRIFNLFVIHGLRCLPIADILNAEAVPRSDGRAWSPLMIRKILGDEKYVGTLVYGHYASFLKRQVVYPRSRWRRIEGGCPALVGARVFAAAQANLRRHKEDATDEQLLEELRSVLKRRGRLSENILLSDPEGRSGRVYERRFGSLSRAFELIGYERTPAQQRMLEKVRRVRPHLYRTYQGAYAAEQLLEKLAALFSERGYLTARLIDETRGVPNSGTYRDYFGSLSRAYELVGYDANRHQRQRFRPARARPRMT
jgi:DNA invertase Pin-like site-specific DNA recombinase